MNAQRAVRRGASHQGVHDDDICDGNVRPGQVLSAHLARCDSGAGRVNFPRVITRNMMIAQLRSRPAHTVRAGAETTVRTATSSGYSTVVPGSEKTLSGISSIGSRCAWVGARTDKCTPVAFARL